MEIFNWFGSILGYLLWFLYEIIPNYGVAIILFTIITKLLLLPFSVKQQKSMAANSKMAAKQQEIRTKYANDRLKMQEEMQAKQAELEAAEFQGTASGGMVEVTMTGKHVVTALHIKPEAVDPDDVEMLEDLIAAAFNDAVRKVDETTEAEMGKLTGGMNIPGL